MARKQFVKTSGTGYDFTENPAEAMHFTSALKAKKMRDRLGDQFTNYIFVVETDPSGNTVLTALSKS